MERYCRVDVRGEVAKGAAFLACSAASLRRYVAILSLDRSADALLACADKPLDDAGVPVIAMTVVAVGGAHLDG